MNKIYKPSTKYVYIILAEAIISLFFSMIVLFILNLYFDLFLFFNKYKLIIILIVMSLVILDIFRISRIKYIEYELDEKMLYIRKGKIFRNISTIYLNKTLSTIILTNPLLNKLNLRGLQVQLVNKEFSIQGLSLKDVLELTKQIDKGKIGNEQDI